METGHFPQTWKRAWLVLINKEDKPQDKFLAFTDNIAIIATA